jgi:hypothetical protein
MLFIRNRSPHKDEVERAKKKLEDEIDSDSFRETGEHDGVKLYIKDDESGSVPTVKGTCVVENATVAQIANVVEVRELCCPFENCN